VRKGRGRGESKRREARGEKLEADFRLLTPVFQNGKAVTGMGMGIGMGIRFWLLLLTPDS
jgi:hypothetical protein